MSDDKHLEPNPDDQPTLDIDQLDEQIVLPDKPVVAPKSAERITITMDDLFDDEPSNPDDEDTLPPQTPPIIDPVIGLDDAFDDGDNTATLPFIPPNDEDNTGTLPFIPPDPDTVDTPPIGNPTPREPEPSQFTPTERPPIIDSGATIVNPKVALPKRGLATRDSQGRMAEEVRRQRRAAREAAKRRREREEQQQQAPPTPRPQSPRPQQPTKPQRAPARELPHNANRIATRDTIEEKHPVREKQGSVPKRVVIPATKPESKKKKRSAWGCISNIFIATFLFILFGFVAAVAGLAIGYVSIANDLPPVRELETRTSTFQTVFIYDAEGSLLYSITDPSAGDRTRVPLDKIDRDVINATIATEDSRFWENPGFDPIAIARAVSKVALSGSFSNIASAGGASTITQQLVRATLLTQDEASQNTARRKIREIILAAELNRQWTRELGDELLAKQKILEIYLNEIYYGNRSYGIEAASRTYFKKSADNLTLAEATLLAGLPQAPALWDPITAPEYALGRQSEVLTLMVAEKYVSSEDAQSALNEVIARGLEPPSVNIRYPHFTLSVLSELEQTYGSDVLYNSGFKVYTTIRPEVQEIAEQTMRDNRAAINARGANNAALVALDPNDGAILALVGSLDYRDESIRGQVNMARASRQPGSTIKPFVFLAAMEKGYTPATLFWDVPSAFPDGANEPYRPKNYDNTFHGPMLLRTALANSYNIPAVKALEAVGVCDFIARTKSWGLNLDDEGCNQTNAPRNVGLALSLGGSEISPLNMSSAYAMLANGGEYNESFGIRRIEVDGQTIYANGIALGEQALTPLETDGVSAELAYLTTNILGDNNARIPEFGEVNDLNLPFPVAAKTGTSGTNEFDVRDAWTIGYTPEIVTAVWVGNTDNEPLLEGASGYRVATPVWKQFMVAYHAGREAQSFARPDTVVEIEICRDSGARITPECSNRRQEVFNTTQPPLPAEQHFYDATVLDRWTLREANEHCDDEQTIRFQSFDLLVSGRNPEIKTRYRNEAEAWLQGSGLWWANQYGLTFPLPQSGIQIALPCEPNTERPIVSINEPFAGDFLTGLVQIGGQATAPGFAGYQLEYGFGAEPTQWFPIGGFQSQRQPGGLLGTWDTSTVEQGGNVLIRLTVFGADNPYTRDVVDRARKEVRLSVQLPQPTATPAPTATPVPTPTNVPPTAVPPTDVPPPTEVPVVEPPTEVPVQPTTVPVEETPAAEPTPNE